MYSMTTDKCRACEIGMKCAGTNQTYMLSGYYGQLESDFILNSNAWKQNNESIDWCYANYLYNILC